MKCRCGEEIQYIKLKESGKDLACDTSLILLVAPSDPQLLISKDGDILITKEPNTVGYEPHWMSCPYAADYRYQRRKKANAKSN